MGYIENDRMVRVDFFAESGKWYTIEAVLWTGGYGSPVLIHEAFATSLRDHFKDNPNRLNQLDAVCLEPYHEFSHPIMLKKGSKNELAMLLIAAICN